MHHAVMQQSESMRAKFMAEMFIWIDKSGFNSVRRFGYSLRGMRPVDHRLLVRGVRYSAVPVMSTTSIHDIGVSEWREI